jgi:hypothetical protein
MSKESLMENLETIRRCGREAHRCGQYVEAARCASIARKLRLEIKRITEPFNAAQFDADLAESDE